MCILLTCVCVYVRARIILTCMYAHQDDKDGGGLSEHLRGHTRLTRGKAAQQGIVVDNISDSNETLIAGRTMFGGKKDEGLAEEADDQAERVCVRLFFLCVSCVCLICACMYV